MWLPADKKKFMAKFKYVEFGKWAFSENQDRWSVFRDGKPGETKDSPRVPTMYAWDEVNSKIDNEGVGGFYTSTFAFDGRNLDRAQSVSNLYFDLDSSEKKDQLPQLALDDARKLYSYLISNIPAEAIRVYFTGKKGFHIEAEAVCLGIGPSADLASTFRFIAENMRDLLELETIDFAVYDPRRMWRIPNTKHQSTGLYKVPITPEELSDKTIEGLAGLAVAPRDLEVPDQEFSLQANEWFRSFIYKKEEEKVSQKDMLNRFLKQGSGITRDVSELKFDPTCFGKCDALERLWRKAETTHDLEHEERLFLASILSYSDEAIQYLHSILAECSDYNPDKSQSHINDWVRRREQGIGGRPYSCKRAAAAGISCNGCESLEPREKYEVVGDKMVPTGEMASPSPVRICYTRER